MDCKIILKRNCAILPTECNRFAPCVCMNWYWIILNLRFLDLKCLNLKLSLLFDTIYSAWACWLLCISFQPILQCHLKNSFLVSEICKFMYHVEEKLLFSASSVWENEKEIEGLNLPNMYLNLKFFCVSSFLTPFIHLFTLSNHSYSYNSQELIMAVMYYLT